MKLKNITTKFSAAAMTAALALGSVCCTDLDETLYSEIPGDGSYEMSPEEVQSMYGKIYDRVRDMYNGWESYQDISDETGDVLMTPFRYETNAFGAQYCALHKHEFYATLNHLYRPWYSCYQGINTCNQLLDEESISQNEQIKAELRTYRALFYYVLFDIYRNIPLETTLKVPAGYMPEQAKPEDTFNFIVTELKEAKPHLSKEVEFGQINYYGACMLLAKMYLNHNAWIDKNASSDMHYYELACDEVNEVINDRKYSLAANYTEPFGNDTFSNEVILAIMYDYTYAGSGTNIFSKWYPAGTSAIFGVTREGWNGSCAIPQFMETYDPADTRKTDTWRWGPQTDTKGNPLYVNGQLCDFTIDCYSIDRPGCSTYQGARMNKFEMVAGKINCANNDVPFFRLADAMFIKAECLLRLGGYKGEDEQVAADLVTEVRQRAFKNNPEKAVRTVAQLKGGSVYDYGRRDIEGDIDANGDLVNIVNNETHEGGADIILGGLLDDLAWEFVYEHHRRQDLIRFEITNGNNVYNGKSWFSKKAVGTRKCDLMPIFQDNLQANPNLKQNPY